MPTGQIANALREGGAANAKKPNFNSIVSAILSQMVAKGELLRTGSGFTVTATGRSAWDAIEKSERFVNRREQKLA